MKYDIQRLDNLLNIRRGGKAVLFVVFLIGVFIAAFIGLLLVYIGNKVLNEMKMDDMNSEMEMKIKKEMTNFKEKSE